MRVEGVGMDTGVVKVLSWFDKDSKAIIGETVSKV